MLSAIMKQLLLTGSNQMLIKGTDPIFRDIGFANAVNSMPIGRPRQGWGWLIFLMKGKYRP
jgi:hypothetical protein